MPAGHPRLEPLLLPLPEDRAAAAARAPPDRPGRIEPDRAAVPRHVTGPGLFTIPHGPVRSGVIESIEYLVETPGEDIPHLNMRLFYKHRGVEKRFEGMRAADGVLLAERVEGIASVAHALAYCHAVERIAGRRGALARRPDPGPARRARTDRQPPRRRRSGWPTPPGWRSRPPGSAGTRNGCCGWSASCAAAGSAAASSCRRGQRAAAVARRGVPRRDRPPGQGGHRRRRAR